MTAPLAIGGDPVVRLSATDAPAEGPCFLEAEILPGRGMMILQAKLRLGDGRVVEALHAPAPAEAARALSGGPDDFNGDRSFSFGGAILAPYANRITGRRVAAAREIETTIAGHAVRLPRNWGGGPARDQYAMHGLILDRRFAVEQAAEERVTGRLAAGDFGWGWPGSADMAVTWSLAGGALGLAVTVENCGGETLPMGIGWHPYFALPSGDRRQARMQLPARLRVEVDNYNEVLPTGRLLPTHGSAYDFSAGGGKALGDLYLDDCFTELARTARGAEALVLDPAAGVGLRITSPTPEVRAMQVYAPPGEAFVVVEPQFNLADPYGAEWPKDRDTGMAAVPPGGSVAYEARVEAFAVRNP